MEQVNLTFDEIFELERVFNDELAERCNQLMNSGNEEQIQEGFRVQYGRFAVRDFLSRIKVYAHNNRLAREQDHAASS